MDLPEPFRALTFKGEPIIKEGETIWEIITEEDGGDFGLALARIVETEPHYHEKTRELYVVVAGFLRLEISTHKRSHLKSMTFGVGAGRAQPIPTGRIHQAWAENCEAAWVLVFTWPAFSSEDYIPTQWKM